MQFLSARYTRQFTTLYIAATCRRTVANFRRYLGHPPTGTLTTAAVMRNSISWTEISIYRCKGEDVSICWWI